MRFIYCLISCNSESDDCVKLFACNERRIGTNSEVSPVDASSFQNIETWSRNLQAANDERALALLFIRGWSYQVCMYLQYMLSII